MYDKIDCKTKISPEENKKVFIMIKRSLHQKDTNNHTCVGRHLTASKYMKQNLTELRGIQRIETIPQSDFNTPLSATGRPKKHTQ